MSAGHLVPDAVVIGIVRERLAQADVRRQGALLDGFPRTRPQAEALENIVAELGLPAPIVINLEISDQEVVRRLSGRLVCASCAAIFNRERDGLEVGDACPRCGGKLYQRDDDRPEAVRERLRLYYEQTAPLIDFYKQRGLLTSVKVEGGQEEVSQRLVEVVASRLGQ
jgi:adenylate kinase